MRFLFLAFLFIAFTGFAEANQKKRRVFKRKLSVSFVNAYTFHASPKGLTPDPFGVKEIHQKPLFGDSQMEKVFSALEISRNFGSYELGVRIQNTFSSFVSPFFKWNIIKNQSDSRFIPSLTLGVSPSAILMGFWLRASVAVSVNRYLSLEPFLGAYRYTKIGEHGLYEKSNSYFHAGLRFNLYY